MTTNTMVALKTVTVPSPTTSVNFDLTGITGYTDLMLVIANGSTNNPTNHTYQFNGDGGAGNLYSTTWLTGNGSSASSNRHTAEGSILPDYNGYMTSTSNVVTISHFMNYANSTTYKTVLSRSNNAAVGVDATVGLWRNLNPITSIQVISGSVNTFNTGVTLTLYGIANADIGAYATGGVITQDANYYYHAFGNSSYFTPTRNLTADILVVAGGGAGNDGGGGAGGVFYNASQSLANGTGYTCTVGAGGSTTAGVNSSVIGGSISLTAIGGGVSPAYSGSNGTAGSGGSGGGAPRGSGSNAGGSPTSGQGYAGGSSNYSTINGAGGGGGAGGLGGNATAPNLGGVGGIGTSAYNSWLSAAGLGVLNPADGLRYIAGGGGGFGAGANAAGGLGGGGTGSNNSGGATAGVVNTGSGGGANAGGSGWSSGGSGLIIVRYAK